MKHITKQALSFILFFSVLLSSLPMIVDASSGENETTAIVMSVTTHDDTTDYTSFSDGWINAIILSKSNPVTLTLHKDWIAGDTNNNGIIDESETAGDFYYELQGKEYGTNAGRLHMATDSMELILDLNGYSINRGLTAAKDKGQVFKIEGGAHLIITDSSDAMTGKITGGYNTGIGGGFYLYDGGKITLNSGCITANKAENGGGVGIANDGSFFMNGGSVINNSASKNGGGVYLYATSEDDSASVVLKGGKISENTAGENGGGVYVNTLGTSAEVSFKNIEISNNSGLNGGGVYCSIAENSYSNFTQEASITDNEAQNGGGVFLNKGNFVFEDVLIMDNKAFVSGGGVTMNSALDKYGEFKFGGTAYIKSNHEWDNTGNTSICESNFLISNLNCKIGHSYENFYGACIGISMPEDYTGDSINISHQFCGFPIDAYKYFTSDNDKYTITTKDRDNYYHPYELYYEKTELIGEISVLNIQVSDDYICAVDPVIDNDNKVISITVNNTKNIDIKNCKLDDIAVFTFSEPDTYIYKSGSERDFYGNPTDMWKIYIGDRFELWHIEVVPSGGLWTTPDNFVAKLVWGEVSKYYVDFEQAWVDALVLEYGIYPTLVLYSDFLAGDSNSNGKIDNDETPGYFKYYNDGDECGTSKGRLHIKSRRLTIDLNGYKIDRGLTKDVKSGQVFKVEQNGRLTIIDSSPDQSGVITGGRNNVEDGCGGAVYLRYFGTLVLKGGKICGNSAQYGGAIGDYNDGRTYIEGGTICHNTAKYGGAISVQEILLGTETVCSITGGIIENNEAEYGGGIYFGNKDMVSKFTVSNAYIRNNTAKYGGGIYIDSDSDATVKFDCNTVICDNIADIGGGIYLYDQAKPTFNDATIKNNRAYSKSGGVFCHEDSRDVLLGGTTYIYENYILKDDENAVKSPSNLHLEEDHCNINNYTENSISDGAKIGISIGYNKDEDLISASGSKFNHDSYKYFVTDDTNYEIAREDVGSGDNRYRIYVTKHNPALASVKCEQKESGVAVSANINGKIIDSKVIFAGYNGAKLVDTKCYNLLKNTQSADLYGDIDSVKVFLWKGCDSLLPLCADIECEVLTNDQ